MIEILLFIVGGFALLAWLGQTATPPAERLRWRQWTPVHLIDLASRGVKVLLDGGKERQRRADMARRNAQGNQREQRQSGDDTPPTPPA